MCVPANAERARTSTFIKVVAIGSIVCPHACVDRDAITIHPVTDISAIRVRLTGMMIDSRMSEGEQRQSGDDQDDGAEHDERCGAGDSRSEGLLNSAGGR